MRDRSLYAKLHRLGLHSRLPKAYRPFPDPVAYYHAHYPGISRGELQKVNRRLYQRLYYDGLLGSVPLASRRTPTPKGGCR